jgi:adenosylhomocysteinase
MDLSFSVQMLSIHHLARHAQEMAPGVYALPPVIDDAIARRRLELLGMKLEEPTRDQLEYARSWR